MGRFCLSVNTLLYRTSRRTAFGVRFKERLGQVQQGRHNPLAPLSKTHSGRTAVYGGIKKNSTWEVTSLPTFQGPKCLQVYFPLKKSKIFSHKNIYCKHFLIESIDYPWVLNSLTLLFINFETWPNGYLVTLKGRNHHTTLSPYEIR